jgi:large subunit ribosomal protein L1
MKNTKRSKDVRSKIDPNKEYEVNEAIALLKSVPKTKFDESVEVAVCLGLDPKKSEQGVRGAVSMPFGLGKKIRVIAFAEGDKAKEAQAAGADVVGSADLAERITGGWLDFEAVVASPDQMKVVGKLGKILGTRGLMPNPKTGTVTQNIGTTIKEIKAGKVEYRTDKGSIVHAAIGKLSFEGPKLVENLKTLIDALIKAKPQTAKGTYLKKISLSSTMGPGLKLNKAFFTS